MTSIELTTMAAKGGRPLVNIGPTTLSDIYAALREAVNTALANAPVADSVVEPLKPVTDIGKPGSPSKFIDFVGVNAYVSDSWYYREQFTSQVTGETTRDLIAIRVKADMMTLAFSALLTDRTTVEAVRAIHIYKLVNKQRRLTTVDISNALSHQDYPYVYVTFPGVVLVKPGEELAIEFEYNQPWLADKTAGASSTSPVTVTLLFKLLPAVKVIPRAASVYS